MIELNHERPFHFFPRRTIYQLDVIGIFGGESVGNDKSLEGDEAISTQDCRSCNRTRGRRVDFMKRYNI
jgi:hypothetical protein